jgi:hypothetical protein
MNRRELIRGAAVVAASSALPAVAQPVSADEWMSTYLQRWWKVHDYLIDLMKQYYGIDEQHEGWAEVEKLACGLVDYNFSRP